MNSATRTLPRIALGLAAAIGLPAAATYAQPAAFELTHKGLTTAPRFAGSRSRHLLGDERIKGTNWAVLFMYDASNPEATIKLFDRGEHFWMFAALGTDQPARIALWDSETWCIYAAGAPHALPVRHAAP